MLPPFIIEEIRKREAERQRGTARQPVVHLPVRRPPDPPPESEEDDKGGVVIIDVL